MRQRFLADPKQRAGGLLLVIIASLALIYYFNEVSPSLNLGVDRWVKPVRFATDGPIGLEFAFLQRDLREGVPTTDGLHWWSPLAYVGHRWGLLFSSPTAFTLLTAFGMAALLLTLWLMQSRYKTASAPAILSGSLATLIVIFFLTSSFLLPMAIYRGRHDIVLAFIVYGYMLLARRRPQLDLLLPVIFGGVVGWNVAWWPIVAVLFWLPQRWRNLGIFMVTLIGCWSLLGRQAALIYLQGIKECISHSGDYVLFNHSLFSLVGFSPVLAVGLLLLSCALWWKTTALIAKQKKGDLVYGFFVATLLLSYAVAPVSYDYRLVALLVFVGPLLQIEISQFLKSPERLALWRLILLMLLLAWLARTPWTNMYYVERCKWAAILGLQFYFYILVRRRVAEVVA